jgi:hypothetical protein
METKMVYVQRELDSKQPRTGKIKGVYAQLQEGYAEEQLATNDQEVLEFFNLFVNTARLK